MYDITIIEKILRDNIQYLLNLFNTSMTFNGVGGSVLLTNFELQELTIRKDNITLIVSNKKFRRSLYIDVNLTVTTDMSNGNKKVKEFFKRQYNLWMILN
jgi:hypothetical protein